MRLVGVLVFGLLTGSWIGFAFGIRSVLRSGELGRLPEAWVRQWHERAGR